MAGDPPKGGHYEDIMKTMALFDRDSIEKDYLLEGSTSIPPLTSSFFTNPFEPIHGENEDNTRSLLLKDYTLNAPAPTPRGLTESFGSCNGKQNDQSTRKKLLIDMDSHYTAMAAAPGGGLQDDIMETMALFNSDSMDKDYLLEGNTSIPHLTSSFCTIPFQHIHEEEEEDNACSLPLKHHTLNTPAPTPHCRTESFSSRNGKRNYQSTRQKLAINTDSHYTHSVCEFADSCRSLSPRRYTSPKLRRATHVHNLCEKKRRNRINEKMKDLQHLIPNSKMTNKASILDEGIEYIKKLQFQVQSEKASILNEANEHIKQLQHQVQMLSSPNKMDTSHNCIPMGVPYFQASQVCMAHSQWNNGCMVMPQGVQAHTVP